MRYHRRRRIAGHRFGFGRNAGFCRYFAELSKVFSFAPCLFGLGSSATGLSGCLLRTPERSPFFIRSRFTSLSNGRFFSRLYPADGLTCVDAFGNIARTSPILGTANNGRFQQKRIVHEFLNRSRWRLLVTGSQQTAAQQ
jgi:hypothetical protein